MSRDWQRNTLPEICMSLHMHHTGSCDDLNDENYESGVKYLRDRVDKWNIHSNGSIWRIFDTTVLALCVATLAEADAYAATRVTLPPYR